MTEFYSLMLKQQREKNYSLLLTENLFYSYFNRNQSTVYSVLFLHLLIQFIECSC